MFWLFIHIAFLTGFRNRFGAILTWWLAFSRDIRRERAFTTRSVGVMQDVYQPTDGTEPACGVSAAAAAQRRAITRYCASSRQLKAIERHPEWVMWRATLACDRIRICEPAASVPRDNRIG